MAALRICSAVVIAVILYFGLVVSRIFLMDPGELKNLCTVLSVLTHADWSKQTLQKVDNLGGGSFIKSCSPTAQIKVVEI